MKKNLTIWIACLALISGFFTSCGDDNKKNSDQGNNGEQGKTDDPNKEDPSQNPKDPETPVVTNPCPECEFGCDESKQCYTCDKGMFVCSDDNTSVLKCTKGQYSVFKTCDAASPCAENSCGDKDNNHMKDEYQPKTPTDCVKNTDCTTGFCDRVIMKCSVKCTDNEQCMKGNLCRSDGYCAPEAFVTEWTYDSNGVGMIVFLPTAYADECDFTVDWGDGSETETYHSCPEENVTHQYLKQLDEEGNLIKKSEIITITGKFNGWRLRSKDGANPLANAMMLSAIHSFGPVGLGEYAFNSLRPIDISEVDIPNVDLLTSMNHMFYEVKFTYGKDETERLMKFGLLSNWDTSNVTDMSYAFAKIKSTRNLDLSKWDTSKVKDMSYMFYYQDTPEFGISNWNVSNVTNMEGMFKDADWFNEPIGSWNVSNVTNMSHMFDNTGEFDQDIGDWNTSKVTDMSYMLSQTWSFGKGTKRDISRWDVSNVTNMEGMFNIFPNFSPAIAAWNVSNVTNMKDMFKECYKCDMTLVNWNVSKVTNMSGMFSGAGEFNQIIDGWNVSNVTDMSEMFEGASKFDQLLRHWNVSKVTNMSGMFSRARSFNGEIGGWDVSNVTDMNRMFNEAEKFNGAIGAWDVSKVTDFTRMFYNAHAFTQDLSNWHPDSVDSCEKLNNMFYSSKVCTFPSDCPKMVTLLHDSWEKASCSAGDLCSHPCNEN